MLWGFLLILMNACSTSGQITTGDNSKTPTPPGSTVTVTPPGATATSTLAPSTTPIPQPSSTEIPGTEVTIPGCPTLYFIKAPDPADQVFTSDDAGKQWSIETNKLIEFRLSKKMGWTINLDPKLFQTAGESGYASGDLCIFRYKTIAKGEGTINFTGKPICAPGQACPLYLQELTYKITVK
jgi:hypothetical protein